jgi:site-specific recombinase
MPAAAHRTVRDLGGLLESLDPLGTPVQRHLWLAELMHWVRGNTDSVPGAVARVRLFADALQARPDKALALRQWWHVMHQTMDIAVLLAEFGFSSRNAFLSEVLERMRQKLLPSTPDTADAIELFDLVAAHRFDAQWLQALDEPLVERIAALVDPLPLEAGGMGQLPGTTSTTSSTTDPAQPDGNGATAWHHTLLEAVTICTSQVRAAGFASELRLRMSTEARQSAPFHSLDEDCTRLRECFMALQAADALQRPAADDAFQSAQARFRAQLEACRAAATSVYAHLDEHGVSMGLVFRIRQLRERILRVRTLLDCLVPPRQAQSVLRLLAQLVTVRHDRRSLRALVASNSSMLAAKVTERSSEVGQHYITRTRSEFRAMLRQAAGGGALTAGTTWLKFGLVTLGLSAFWNGFWAGILYAASFVLIQLLHCTLATKQPAMTAPALAAKLKDVGTPEAMESFVDEVTHLVRSQVAAVIGNVGLVVPVTVLLSLAIQWTRGHPMLTPQEAQYVFHNLHLLGPSVLFAAFTGVLLFSSSIIAGWTENWFVFNRLDSALRHNPAFTRRLGAARADRWATFLRQNISGLASNISLGLMLGLIPAVMGFFGLGLDVRHVTLSAGQLAAAAASSGWGSLREAAFWWCVATIPLIGLLNLTVSFYCALRLAVLSHAIAAVDRKRLTRAVRARLLRHPLSFLWPAREAAPAPAMP